MTLKIIDGHSDLLSRSLNDEVLSSESFFTQWQNCHLDFPRLLQSFVRVLICAVFVPNPLSEQKESIETEDGFRRPLANPIDKDYAQSETAKMLAIYSELIERASGQFLPITDCKTLDRVLEGEERGSVLMFEGADMIEPDLSNLEEYYNIGLRILSLTWSRKNSFATGVPYEFPGSPDQGPGLSDEGRALVERCNSLGILIDVSHLNAKGFWDVMKLAKLPVVATHSGVHAKCPCPRNLTDEQLRAIADTGGLVGVTFSTSEIRSDGKLDVNTPVQAISEHVLHAIEVMGSEYVAFGSDFEGTIIPDEIQDICGYNVLINDLKGRKVGQEDLAKISFKNWRRVLGAIL